MGAAATSASYQRLCDSNAYVTAVTIERKGCFGGCPIYTLTLQRDGNARYVGKAGPRLGLYTTKLLWTGTFDQLSKAISELHFLDLSDGPGEPSSSMRNRSPSL
jgi:hypothetical protein